MLHKQRMNVIYERNRFDVFRGGKQHQLFHTHKVVIPGEGGEYEYTQSTVT